MCTTYGVEDAGALVVVDVGVKVVDANSVDTQNLHQSSISEALLLVAQRILSSGRVVAGAAAGLVGHSDDLELVASLGVDEVGSLDLEGSDGTNYRGPKGHEGSVDLEESCQWPR